MDSLAIFVLLQACFPLLLKDHFLGVNYESVQVSLSPFFLSFILLDYAIP